jgi:hypothetical protein
MTLAILGAALGMTACGVTLLAMAGADVIQWKRPRRGFQ